MKSIFYLSFVLFLFSCSKDVEKKETESIKEKMLNKFMSEDEADEELQELKDLAESGEATDEYNVGAYYAGKASPFREQLAELIMCYDTDDGEILSEKSSEDMGRLKNAITQAPPSRIKKAVESHLDYEEEDGEKSEKEHIDDFKKSAKEINETCAEAVQGFSFYRTKSLEWLEKSAQKSYLPAIKKLGRIFFKDAAIEKDEKKRLELYEKAHSHLKEAVARGDKKSHVYLGEMYSKALWVKKDLKKALYHYKNSALVSAQKIKEIEDAIEMEKNKADDDQELNPEEKPQEN